jgi:hypothetical protein
MELGNKLSAEVYNEYANKLYDLGEKIMLAGYDLSNKVYPNIFWRDLLEYYIIQNITPKYPPHLIKEEIFNPQEKILETLDYTVDWVNPYSQSSFEFSKSNGALYRYVKRWFDWLEYNEKIVGGEIQKQQHLYSLENGAEEQVFGINGEPILTLEGYFGE